MNLGCSHFVEGKGFGFRNREYDGSQPDILSRVTNTIIRKYRLCQSNNQRAGRRSSVGYYCMRN